MLNNDRPLPNRASVLGHGLTAVRTIWLFAALSACVVAVSFTITVVLVVLPAEREDRATDARVEHTYQVIDALDGIMASAADAETGARGFLLNGDTRYLEPYDSGIKTIWQRFAAAQRLTADNQSQQSRLAIMRGVMEARLALLARAVELTRGGDVKAVADMVRKGDGKALMDEMRGSIAEMKGHEQNLLRARHLDSAEAQKRSNRVTLLLVIFGSFGALLGGASATDASLAAHARKFSEATSAERLRLLNMVDFVPVMMLDRHGVVRFWSEGCHQLYGWSAEQAVGQSAHALLRAVASVTVDEMEAELLRTGEWSGEVCHQARNGEKLIVLAHKVLRRDTDGSRVGDNLTVIDVTTLRQTETALRASEAQFHAVVDAAADAIIIAHFDGGIHNVNPAALRIFGYDRIEELIGRDLAVLMPATDAARHAGYIANHQAGTPSRVIGIPGRQLLATRRDGTEFPIELSVGSFGLDGHQYLTGIVRDVSDRIAAEIALRDSEARLCEALKMEVVGRLAAGVAHDFNNVLQCVAGGLEMVLDNVAAGSLAHEFARIAMSSAMRGAELTHHLLAYARKQVLQPKHVDVAPFLAETRTLLSRTLGQHIAIEIRADQMLPRIHVDPGMLRTALLNLAINAAYAMPKGGTLRLDARVDSADAAFVVIAVTDTGIGMDEATLAQAFEPFFTTKGQDGTGLGLPMVQGFARQSGGEVRIESAPDQGTMIELRLPAAALAVGPVTQPDAPANLRGAGRILLVDDNPDVRVITAAFLTGVGFQVVAAANGDEALAFLVRGERFDILVTDYIMPGMNGVDLVGHVREIQPGMAALIITGFAAAADTDVLPESVTILRKPFQRPRLIEAVLRAMAMS